MWGQLWGHNYRESRMAVPPKLKLNLRLTESLRLRAQAMADKEQVSLNTLLVSAVENYLPYREREWQYRERRQARDQQARGRALPTAPVPKVGVNQPCPCGSGVKYKRCHGKSGTL